MQCCCRHTVAKNITIKAERSLKVSVKRWANGNCKKYPHLPGFPIGMKRFILWECWLFHALPTSIMECPGLMDVAFWWCLDSRRYAPASQPALCTIFFGSCIAVNWHRHCKTIQWTLDSGLYLHKEEALSNSGNTKLKLFKAFLGFLCFKSYLVSTTYLKLLWHITAVNM